MADPNRNPVPFTGSPVNQPSDPYFARDYFVYELDFSALGAGDSSTQTFTIQADSDFLWNKATYFADIAAAVQTADSRVIPLCTVLIQDTGSGRNLMSSGAPLSNVFGTGELPLILPRQRIFLARAQVSVTMTNFSAATTYDVRLSFIGEKGFRRS